MKNCFAEHAKIFRKEEMQSLLSDIQAKVKSGMEAEAAKLSVVEAALDQARADQVEISDAVQKIIGPRDTTDTTAIELARLAAEERRLEREAAAQREAEAKVAEEAKQATAEADAIMASARKRMTKADPAVLEAKPSVEDWLTPEEKRRVGKIAPDTPAQPETPEASNTEDSGAELSANRRNRIRTGIKWEDILGKNETLRIAETTKQNVYPRPDYEAMVEGGIDPVVAHLVKQVYDSIAAKPSFGMRQMPTDDDLKAYIDGVNRVMSGVMDWANDKQAAAAWAQSQARTAGAMLGRSVALSELAEKPKSMLDRVYPEGWRAHQQEVRIIGGNKPLGAMQPGHAEARRAFDAIKGGWPAKQEAWQKSFVIEAKEVRADDVPKDEQNGGPQTRHFVMEKARKWRMAKGSPDGGFATNEAAVEFARALTKRENKTGISDKGISVEAAERVGEARRMEGEDITSDTLRDTFGFKGVNFGNWMKGDANKAERQLHLNHAYDAFLDLAEVLNVPPKAMSLNGMLGVAIGAQGGGGNAAAHFVPGVNEINLTRTSGAGSLAHEWGHALDHYFANQAGLAKSTQPFLTEHTARPAFAESLRPEIADVFRTIVRTMNKREETRAQMEARLAAVLEKNKRNVDGWLASIKRDFMAGQVDEQKFDALAERIRNLDLGEGAVSAGSVHLSQAVDELRALYKAKTGRNYSLDQMKGLQSNVDHAVYLTSERAAERNHVPQQVGTDYAAAAARLDKEKGGKPYWGTNLEKFARAFDAFVSDSLEAKAAKNTYLSHQGRTGETVPMGDERTEIDKAFQSLVDTVDTKETDKGTALFRRGAQSAAPIREAVASALAKLKIPSTIHDSIEQARAVTGIDIPDDANGMYSNGHIHLFAENLNPLTAQQTLWHEVLHAGLRHLYGKDSAGYHAALVKIAAQNQNVREAAKQWRKDFGNDAVARAKKIGLNDEESARYAVMQSYDEALADLSGRNETISGMKPFLAKVQAFLRYIGLDKLADAMEGKFDAEALKLVSRARDAVMQGDAYVVRGEAAGAYSRSDMPKPFPQMTDAAYINNLKEMIDIASQIRDKAIEEGNDAKATRYGRRIAEHRAELKMLREQQGKGMPLDTSGLNVPDASNPDIRFSRTVAPKWSEGLPQAQQDALKKAGVILEQKTLVERARELKADFGKKFTQGLFDQVAPIKQLDYKAYMLARLSRGSDGGLEAMMLYGRLYLDGGALNVGMEGGLMKVFQSLQGEHDRALAWIAGNRAEQLKIAGKENLFTDTDISALKDLNQGQMPDGQPRDIAYADFHQKFNAYMNSVLDIAEETGLIDAESREVWAKDFYVPFYRVMEDGGGPTIKSGLVNQYAFKKLKGGQEELRDLMANTLMNWSHLLSASLKNQSADATLKAAEAIGIARPIPAQEKGAVSVIRAGQKAWYEIDDPFILDAVTAMEWTGFKGPAMEALGKFKRALTIGVTANPTFKLRNLMRDTAASVAQSNLSYNAAKNLAQGWRLTAHDSQTRASMMASGGLMRFGTLLEGNTAVHAKRLTEAGVDANTILDKPHKVVAMMQKAWDAYQELGDRGEQVNRAALYQQLRDRGLSHLEASFQARDLLDFSMQGKWTTIRFLTQVVPFMNARLQGMYKLGRAYKENPARMYYVMGALSVASAALLLWYHDDDDWKKREDWDRDQYWWFKVGGLAFRIPKPFEVGAVASVAERTLEYLISDERDPGHRFLKSMGNLVSNNLSMNPTPQLVKPLIDLYANKDSFTGRPIETQGMESLSKGERVGRGTTLPAQILGKLDPTDTFSPVQIDFLARAYFGWLGTTALTAVDFGLRPLSHDKPAMQLRQFPVIGNFVEGLPTEQSRYVTVFYDEAKKIDEAYADYRNALRLGDKEKAADLMQNRGELIRQEAVVASTKRMLGSLNQQERKIELNVEISPGAKRTLLDAIAARKDELARQLAR